MNTTSKNIFRLMIIIVFLGVVIFLSLFLVRSAIQYNQKMQFREGLLDISIGTSSKFIVDKFGFPDIYLPTGQILVRYKLKRGRMVELNYGLGTEIIGITEIYRDGTRRYIGW